MEENIETESKSPAKKNIKKNYIYNLTFQIFLLLAPIIVTPYVSRVLTNEGIGKYSFAYSIVYYFTIIAAFGFNYYAQREIAKNQNNKEKQSLFFWEITIIKAFTVLISCALYIGIQFIPGISNYRTLLLLLILNVVAILFDSTFIYQGNEDFKKIAIFNIVVKAITIALIFLLIKEKADLWIYTLINSLSPMLLALIMIPYLKKYLVKVKIKDLHPKKHLLPSFKLFIPTIAVSVYVMLDKTMIGLIVQGNTTIIENGIEVTKKISDLENAYYEQAEKIIKMALTIITALGAIMIPRNSSCFKEGKIDQLKNNIYKSFHFSILLAIPMILGFICISKIFSPIFFGEGYEKVPYLMMLLSPIILAIGLTSVLGVQYLIPTGKDTLFTITVSAGAIINFIINIFMITFFASYGAAIATVIAEFTVLLVQMLILKKELNYKQAFKESWKCLLAGVLMFVPCYYLSTLLSTSILSLVVIFVTGVAIYSVSIIILKDSLVINVLTKLTNTIKKNKKVE